MPKQIDARPKKAKKAIRVSDPAAEMADRQVNTATIVSSCPGKADDGHAEAQGKLLRDTRFQMTQRRALTAQIGRVRGNRYLQRVIAIVKGDGKALPHQSGREKPKTGAALEVRSTTAKTGSKPLVTTSDAHSRPPDIQRDTPKGRPSRGSPASGGELAWEIFKPTIVGGIRSLAPGVLKTTTLGKHYKEVIDIADKVESTAKTLSDYEKKISELKAKAESERKFSLKSLGKVHKHIKSLPDALDLDGDKLINQAAAVVNAEMFTNMSSAVAKLQTYAAIVKETRNLRSPYSKMIGKLSEAERTSKASFDALGVLEDALLDVAKVAVLPAFQAWAFGMSLTVSDYRSDAGTILSTLRHKRKGYEKAIASSKAMEAYMSGAAGRKALSEGYRDPKSAECVSRVKAALPHVKSDTDAIYDKVLTYTECTFGNVMDALDFLPIEDSDGFFAITEGMKDAYNDRVSTIEAKEKRYAAGLTLYVKLNEVRPRLQAIEAMYDPLVMPFIFQEYYHFWRDDPRPLLSNRRFTYTHNIKQMTKNVGMLVAAALSFSYFESK